jgi:hypothetical protein
MTPLLLLAAALAAPPDLPAPSLEEARPEDARPLPPEVSAYLRWAGKQAQTEHPEPAYRFEADVHAAIRPLVEAMPERVTPIRVGRSVENRPIWGFRVREHRTPVSRKLLVFANIHALEWITTEVATDFLREIAANPPPGVEVVVVPVLNPDGRAKVERDLREGRNIYRRGNLPNVDLNRDFAVNREARAVWRHIIPRRYVTSEAPLSQPESQALDRLAAREEFDVAVSLHAYGGWLFYPWAGDWQRPADRATFERLSREIQRGQGARAYNPKQLGRWAFFFRGHGMELDHLYGEHGTLAFLWELTRGRSPLAPGTWKSKFRIYNPPDPSRAIRRDVGGLRALTSAVSWEARGLLDVPEDERALRRDPPLRPGR